MACGEDPEEYVCDEVCNGVLSCCGSACKASCSDCQLNNPGTKERSHHNEHPCKRELHCGHLCEGSCTIKHVCPSVCAKECRLRCSHGKCGKSCSEPCSPCRERCTWYVPMKTRRHISSDSHRVCKHHQCQALCGRPCSRLPCDERCSKFLGCGHPCPSCEHVTDDCGQSC